MVVTTSSKKGRLEEYLAVEDLREFPYLLFVIRVDFVSVAPLTEDEIRAINEAGALDSSSKAEVGKCLPPTWSSLGIFAAVG